MEGSALNDGEVAGVAVGCLFMGVLIGAGVVFLRFRWAPIKRHKSFEVDVAEQRKEEETI